jgi:hypothetical protein
MRELIEARDATHELSIRLALDAAGIKAVCEHRRWMPPRFLLEHDEDFARASSIVRSLQVTPTGLQAGTPGTVRARIVIGGALAMLFVYAMWRVLHGPRP